MPLYEEETKTLINEVMMLWENCLPLFIIFIRGLPSNLGITAWVWAKYWDDDAPDFTKTSSTGWCWPKTGVTFVASDRVTWVYSGYINCP